MIRVSENSRRDEHLKEFRRNNVGAHRLVEASDLYEKAEMNKYFYLEMVTIKFRRNFA